MADFYVLIFLSVRRIFMLGYEDTFYMFTTIRNFLMNTPDYPTPCSCLYVNGCFVYGNPILYSLRHASIYAVGQLVVVVVSSPHQSPRCGVSWFLYAQSITIPLSVWPASISPAH